MVLYLHLDTVDRSSQAVFFWTAIRVGTCACSVAGSPLSVAPTQLLRWEHPAKELLAPLQVPQRPSSGCALCAGASHAPAPRMPN